MVALLVGSSAEAEGRSMFEVAVVKPSVPNSGVGVDFRLSPGGRLIATNISLRLLIREAYGVRGDQIFGAPAWFDTSRYDIGAKAEGNPSRELVMVMLQALLEDKFKLRIHRERKNSDLYAIVIARGGPKLKPAAKDEVPFLRTSRAEPAEQAALSYVLTGQRVSMGALADRLSSILSRPVLDRTGLNGEYDLKLEFAADDHQTDTAPSMFAAIRRLGLKLIATKGEVDVLAVTYAEKLADQ
jgi:uncharacterized protein (TIGR03435 family)